MKLLEKFLVPVDVNADSTEQINAAVKLASIYKSEVMLLYVVPEDDLSDHIKRIVLKSVMASLNEIKAIFIRSKVAVSEPEVFFGKVVDTIVQKANEGNVNLVLIGSKEKQEKEKFKLGVIAEQIIREAETLSEELVPGDIVLLESGMKVPVDDPGHGSV